MKEYKVTRDISRTGDNSIESLERDFNAMAAQGWQLAEALTFAAGSAQKMYFFWQRDKA